MMFVTPPTGLSLEVMPLRMTLTPYFLIPCLQISDGYKTCSIYENPKIGTLGANII
jgi:hypothetical protein